MASKCKTRAGRDRCSDPKRYFYHKRQLQLAPRDAITKEFIEAGPALRCSHVTIMVGKSLSLVAPIMTCCLVTVGTSVMIESRFTTRPLNVAARNIFGMKAKNFLISLIGRIPFRRHLGVIPTA